MGLWNARRVANWEGVSSLATRALAFFFGVLFFCWVFLDFVLLFAPVWHSWLVTFMLTVFSPYIFLDVFLTKTHRESPLCLCRPVFLLVFFTLKRTDVSNSGVCHGIQSDHLARDSEQQDFGDLKDNHFTQRELCLDPNNPSNSS